MKEKSYTFPKSSGSEQTFPFQREHSQKRQDRAKPEIQKGMGESL